MTISAAVQSILDVIDDSGPRTRSRSVPAVQTPPVESDLAEAPPSLLRIPVSIRTGKKIVRFEDDPKEGPSTRTNRSTRGVASERLVDAPPPLNPTRSKGITKRLTSTQQPQLPFNPLKQKRKPLSNAANTLAKMRTTSTSKKTKIQALPPKKQPAKMSTRSGLNTLHLPSRSGGLSNCP